MRQSSGVQKLDRLLVVASLAVLCCWRLGTALAAHQSALTNVDKYQIVRVLLKAEIERRNETFQRKPQLSSENIEALVSFPLTVDLELRLLSPGEIRRLAGTYLGADYLVFREISTQGEGVIVRVSAVKEVTGCFGGYQRVQKDYAYRMEKVGGEWKAELLTSRLPGNLILGGKLPAFGNLF